MPLCYSFQSFFPQISRNSIQEKAGVDVSDRDFLERCTLGRSDYLRHLFLLSCHRTVKASTIWDFSSKHADHATGHRFEHWFLLLCVRFQYQTRWFNLNSISFPHFSNYLALCSRFIFVVPKNWWWKSSSDDDNDPPSAIGSSSSSSSSRYRGATITTITTTATNRPPNDSHSTFTTAILWSNL